jgi:hypothetical protein
MVQSKLEAPNQKRKAIESDKYRERERNDSMLNLAIALVPVPPHCKRCLKFEINCI